jgi:hypothetical protein
MLEQLVKQIQQGGIYSVAALARQFDVSEALVEQMLAELARLGYLRTLDTCGNAACTGCPQSAGCGTRRPAQTWVYEDPAKKG